MTEKPIDITPLDASNAREKSTVRDEKSNPDTAPPKTTNVEPGDLNYDHYEAEKYEDDIRRSIPGYEEMHTRIDAVVDSYAETRAIHRVLDLGVGTGLTAERLMKRLPEAALTAVDFSEQMLNGAKKRLAGMDATFLVGDYSEIDVGKEYDVIASVIGLHHQNDAGKRNMFKKIYDALTPGGVFIFGDLVTYRDAEKAAQNDAAHFQFLRDHARDAASLAEWEHHHREQNMLAPIEDQIDWLKEAGFSEVEVQYEQLNTVLIIARK